MQGGNAATKNLRVRKGEIQKRTSDGLLWMAATSDDSGKITLPLQQTPQHVYFISDEPIKEGEWYMLRTNIKESLKS